MLKKWYLYIVKCKDGSYYTGISTDIKRRISEHNSKVGAKSLYGKLPVVLAYKEVFKNQIKAARREREIKGWDHEQKVIFIDSNRQHNEAGISAARLGTLHRA